MVLKNSLIAGFLLCFTIDFNKEKNNHKKDNGRLYREIE